MRSASSISKRALAGLLLAAASGCDTIPQASLPPDIGVTASPSARPLSPRVALMADSQIHYLYGMPRSVLHTEFGDKATAQTRAAIRPVQLDFYGRYLLDYMLQDIKEDIIYLGDALDVSCKQELTTFTRLLARNPERVWVMAPGNHDGYFLGVHHWGDRAAWDEACGADVAGNGALDKANFVEAYLHALTRNGSDKTGTLAEALRDGKDGWRHPRPGEPSLLRAARWSIDHARPWRSFVVQELDLSLAGVKPGSQPRVVAFLLDTVAYSDRPTMPPWSLLQGFDTGSWGDLVEAQVRILEEWTERAADEGAVVLFMGHHPHEALLDRGRAALDGLLRKTGSRLYVSAHTHAGHWIAHDDAPQSWVELNVGSTLDWPPEYRYLTVSDTDAGVVVHSPLERMDEAFRIPSRDPPACLPAWESARDAEFDDYYLSYRDFSSLSAVDTQNRLMDVLLRSHRRMLHHVRLDVEHTNGAAVSIAWPACCTTKEQLLAAIERELRSGTGPTKAALLREIDAFVERLDALQRQYPPEDDAARMPVREQFGLCSAMWASKYEWSRSRGLTPHDATVTFPKP
jgi:hypothetical protein